MQGAEALQRTGVVHRALAVLGAKTGSSGKVADGAAMLKWFLVTVLALLLFSGLQPLLRRLGWGRLPGDLHLRVGRRNLWLPLGSTLLLSLLVALISRWL